ncbi:hypothetical protein DOY81_010373, partial [Sarcophaga bullata]
CQLCGKKILPGQVSVFTVPKDEERRRKWSEICKVNLTPSGRICTNHFSSADMVVSGTKKILLPKAVPIMNTVLKTSFQSLQNLETALKQCREKKRQLETENKDLKCKLYQANLAVDAMRKIFSEGQIRKLMSPSYVHWSWEDITNAVYLHEAGPGAYNHLYDKGFPLPHSSTLRRWCERNDKKTANTPLNEEIRATSVDKSKEEQVMECDSSVEDDMTTSTAC